jgi:propanediol dehydratase large subunit
MIAVQLINSNTWARTNRDMASDLLYTDIKNEAEVINNGIIKDIPNALVFMGWSFITKALIKSQNEKVKTIMRSNWFSKLRNNTCDHTPTMNSCRFYILP